MRINYLFACICFLSIISCFDLDKHEVIDICLGEITIDKKIVNPGDMIKVCGRNLKFFDSDEGDFINLLAGDKLISLDIDPKPIDDCLNIEIPRTIQYHQGTIEVQFVFDGLLKQLKPCTNSQIDSFNFILEVSSVTPTNGRCGDIITIGGERFRPDDLTSYSIIFNNSNNKCYPLSVSSKSMEIKVPDLTPDRYEIYLQDERNNTTESLGGFNYKNISIDNIIIHGRQKDNLISIIGKNFRPSDVDNLEVFFFGNIEQKGTYKSNTEIIVSVPQIPPNVALDTPIIIQYSIESCENEQLSVQFPFNYLYKLDLIETFCPDSVSFLGSITVNEYFTKRVLYITDQLDNVVYKLEENNLSFTNSTFEVFSGTKGSTNTSNNVCKPVRDAFYENPLDIVSSLKGSNIYILDGGNKQIRIIDLNNSIFPQGKVYNSAGNVDMAIPITTTTISTCEASFSSAKGISVFQTNSSGDEVIFVTSNIRKEIYEINLKPESQCTFFSPNSTIQNTGEEGEVTMVLSNLEGRPVGMDADEVSMHIYIALQNRRSNEINSIYKFDWMTGDTARFISLGNLKPKHIAVSEQFKTLFFIEETNGIYYCSLENPLPPLKLLNVANPNGIDVTIDPNSENILLYVSYKNSNGDNCIDKLHLK